MDLATQRITVVGHSMGGDLGTLLCLQDLQRSASGSRETRIVRFVNVEGNLTEHDLFISGQATRAAEENRFEEWFSWDFMYRQVFGDWCQRWLFGRRYLASLQFCDPVAFRQNAIERANTALKFFFTAPRGSILAPILQSLLRGRPGTISGLSESARNARRSREEISMTTTHRAVSRMAIVSLLSPLALFAQASSLASQEPQGRYQDIQIQHELQIQVKDLDSGQVIATVQPGGTITLREGQRVRLIMTADRPGRGRGVIYPETEFTETEPGRGWVRVTRTNEENSNATLEIVRPSNASRNRTETLRYRVTEDIGLPNSLREGTILVRAEPATGSATGTGISSQQARDLTRRLYRAILMREPDAAGSRRYVEAITSGGYPALVRVAEQLAKSDESRIRVYEREGVCNEQRLLSLFKNLLDLSANQIDREQWDADLSRLRDGQMDAVVEAMVRSTRFQQIHNLERVAIRY